MISLGRLVAKQALDDAFCRLMAVQAAAAIVTRDLRAFCRNVDELCEARRQGVRAIDSDLAG